LARKRCVMHFAPMAVPLIYRMIIVGPLPLPLHMNVLMRHGYHANLE
jgi:hypothetical protein